MAVSVTSKGQVTIPKRVREALGITRGSKVEFHIEGKGVRLELIKKQAHSRIEDGPAILSYSGPRIPIELMIPKRGKAVARVVPEKRKRSEKWDRSEVMDAIEALSKKVKIKGQLSIRKLIEEGRK